MKTILNKKLTLLKVSNAFERENRKRNVILTVTTAFSIMSLFLLLSIINGRVKADDIKRIRENGNSATAILENVSVEQYLDLAGLSYVEKTGIIQNFGVWYQDNRKVAVCSIASEEDFKEMYLPAYDHVAGKYPEKRNEIMLSVRIINSLGIEEPEIGMEIPVHIVLYDWARKGTEDIEMIFRLSGYYTDYTEDLEKLPKAFFSEELARTQKISSFKNDALIKSDKLWTSYAQAEKQFYMDVVLEDRQKLQIINVGGLETIQSMAGNCILAFFGILLIVFSMNLFTYNIFSVSVGRKIKDYGLLKVIGAGPGQIRVMFIFSAVKIMLSGCVLGILSGSLAAKFILPRLLEKMYLAGNGNINHAGLYSVNLMIAAVVLSGIGEVFAFGRCIRTVMSLSPIECLKHEGELGEQEFKTDFPAYRLLSLRHCIDSSLESRSQISRCCGIYGKDGIAGIAWRNFIRNRKKMLMTIVSLFIGIEVCLLAVVISNGLDRTNKISQEPDFEVGVTKDTVEYFLCLNEGNALEDLEGHQLLPEEMIAEIVNVAGISSNSIKKCAGGFGTFSYRSGAIKPRIDSWQYDSEIITGLTVQVVSGEWIDKLEAYVRKKGYDTDVNTLRGGNGFILLHGHELSARQLEEADAAVGEKLSGILFEESGNDFELVCCGYLDFSENGFPKLNMPWDGKNLNYIIISEQTMATLGMKPVIYNISFDAGKKDEQETKNIVQGILRDANQNLEFTNIYYLKAASDTLAKEQNYIFAIRMTMGGFSGILMFFSCAGYCDTLLTGYMSRRKEFAIMKDIGMTMRQLRKMLVYEGIFYCILASALVLTLGSGILLATGKVMQSQVSYFMFRYPTVCTLGALAVMFLVSIFLPLFLYASDKLNYRK